MARLAINLTANDRASPAIQRLGDNTRRYSRRAGSSFRGVNQKVQTFSRLLRGAAAIMATGALARGVRSFAEMGDELAKTSRDMGVTVEQLQELRFAGEQLGVTNGTLDSSFDSLNRRLGRARDGYGSLQTSLEKSNPALLEQMTSAEDSEEAFRLLISEMRGIENQSERAALAQAAFSSSGSDMVRFANASEEEINALMETQREAGNITEEQAEQSEAFNDALNSLRMSLMGVANRGLAPLIEQMTPLIESMREWINENQELIQQRIEGLFQRITAAARVFAALWEAGVIQAVVAGTVAFKAVTGAILLYRAATIKATIATIAANAAFLATPLGLIIVGITAAVAAIVLLIKNWDWVVDKLKMVGRFLYNVFLRSWVMLFQAIGERMSPLLGFFAELWDGIVAVFQSAWERVQVIIDRITNAVAAVRSAISAVGSALGFGGGDEQSGSGGVIGRNDGTLSRSEQTNRSEVDVRFGNVPAGTQIRQRGAAPGVSVAYGGEGGNL